jgi:hypothetical protein
VPRAAVVPALLVALAYPLEAPGDPVPASVRLAWVRGADADACPDGAWLRREVARRLRRDPFDDDGPRSIEAVVERAAPGWRATLRVRDREGTLLGERTLTHDAERCDPIADASALAIALAVDPDAVIDEPARAQATPPTAPPSPRPRPPRPRAPRAAARPAGPSLALGILGGVSAGITPSPAPIVGLVGAVGLSPRWSARLRVDLAPSRSSGDPGFVFGFTRATALGCGAPWRSESLALTACAGLSGALVHAAVRNGRALDAGDQPWLGAVVSAGLQWSPWAWCFVGVEAEGAVALARSSFRYRPDGAEIVTQPLVSGGGSVTLGLRTP